MQIDFKKVALNEFLEHKTMYYDKIDFTIVESSWQILSSKIKLPFVIHIVGTNGTINPLLWIIMTFHPMIIHIIIWG